MIWFPLLIVSFVIKNEKFLSVDVVMTWKKIKRSGGGLAGGLIQF